MNSFGSALGNHLVQTTVFAFVVWLLTLFLRNNTAQTRYFLWLAASAKFLIPFALFINLGSQIPWRVDSPPAATAIFEFSHSIEKPVHNPMEPVRTTVPSIPPRLIPWLGIALWLTGSIAILTSRLIRARRVAIAVRNATRLRHGVERDGLWRAGKTIGIEREIEIRISPDSLEPGVFGILHPVLILPVGVSSSLPEQQLETIFAHELCHVSRRDNLTATIHAIVEVLFWFHPLVWWIGKRMIEERERACDEAVVQSGADPQTYAQGILNVCKLYVQASVISMQGVTGADLIQRISEIMSPGLPSRLNMGKKILLASAGLAALLGPVALGLFHAPPVRGQESRQRLAFETASVKPNNSADRRDGRGQILPGGRLVFKDLPLLEIIAAAYDLPFQSPRLTFAPELRKELGEFYDVEATAAKGAIPPGLSQKAREEKVNLMLQSLLEDRFKLKMRVDSKEQPVYALIVDKGGPKLEVSKTQEKDCDDLPSSSRFRCHQVGGGQGRGIHGDAITIADVALFVQNWSDKPVIDKTGLTALYNIQTEGWQPMRPRPFGPDGKPTTGGDAGIYDPDRQTLFDVFRQLGMKMESQRAVIDMYLIDHIERPTAN